MEEVVVVRKKTLSQIITLGISMITRSFSFWGKIILQKRNLEKFSMTQIHFFPTQTSWLNKHIRIPFRLLMILLWGNFIIILGSMKISFFQKPGFYFKAIYKSLAHRASINWYYGMLKHHIFLCIQHVPLYHT